MNGNGMADGGSVPGGLPPSSRAVVMEAPGRLTVREFPVPEPQPGAVLLRVALSGICGTDKHTFRGESKQYAGTPHERDLRYPLICGHENVGTVAALGGEVRDFEGQLLRPGDRIVHGANVACGRCGYCQGGYPYYMCENLEDYGNSLACDLPPHLFGGWSQYLYLLPGTPLFRVPENLPDRVAVFTEVMAVTHGVDTALIVLGLQGGTAAGATVAVLGAGPLGLCHLVKARLLGAGTIIATDRLAAAGELGADLVLDVAATEPAERADRIRAATGGHGADLVLDCTGVPGTFAEALRLARPGGVVVEPGAFVDAGPVPVNPNSDICTRNVAVLGIGGEKATAYLPSMRLMAANLERLPLDRLVSHVYGLERAAEAVAMAQAGEARQVVFDPWREPDD